MIKNMNIYLNAQKNKQILQGTISEIMELILNSLKMIMENSDTYQPNIDKNLDKMKKPEKLIL